LESQKVIMRQFVSTFAAMFFLASIHAELPPSAYERMQNEAPESLNLDILRVSVVPETEPDRQNVHITARIVNVNRTSSNLQVGGVLSILYTLTARPPGFVGPGQVSIPSEGDKTVAYLRKMVKPDEFEPAAGAMTFRNF
jgi:hypothetical protein